MSTFGPGDSDPGHHSSNAAQYPEADKLSFGLDDLRALAEHDTEPHSPHVVRFIDNAQAYIGFIGDSVQDGTFIDAVGMKGEAGANMSVVATGLSRSLIDLPVAMRLDGPDGELRREQLCELLVAFDAAMIDSFTALQPDYSERFAKANYKQLMSFLADVFDEGSAVTGTTEEKCRVVSDTMFQTVLNDLNTFTGTLTETEIKEREQRIVEAADIVIGQQQAAGARFTLPETDWKQETKRHAIELGRTTLAVCAGVLLAEAVKRRLR